MHAAREHKASDAATTAQREAIGRINMQYKDKFGFIFLTSAFGRDAEDILNEGRSRLKNCRSIEVQRAKIEEGRILAGRLYEDCAVSLFSNDLQLDDNLLSILELNASREWKSRVRSSFLSIPPKRPSDVSLTCIREWLNLSSDDDILEV